MFGYVLPNVANLRIFENEIYKATYCGLCKQIKKNFGFFSRLNLSYDMVFFSIFCISYSNEKIEFEKKFCKLHPFKKRVCIKNCNSLKKAAFLGIIFSYYKIKDNFLDCKGLKKLFSWVLLKLFKNKFKAATKNEQQTANFVLALFKNQADVEKTKNMSLDFYCHPTANCLGLIFKQLFKKEPDKKHLYRTGYMLGKFVYLMDALDDLEKDFKNKSFNPIIASCKNFKLNQKALSNTIELINFSIAQLAESFEKLEIKNNYYIIQNVIYLGLKNSKNNIIKKNKKFYSSFVKGDFFNGKIL